MSSEPRQIRTGQVWKDPGTGDTIRIDEVYASDPWNSSEWRAKVRYTVSDGREADVVDAKEFGDWIREYDFTLVAAEQAQGGRMNELDAIRARRAAITPGVWEPRISKEVTDHEVIVYDTEIDYTVTVAVCNSSLRYMDNEPNARFIAAAPADVDTLLAMVERLTGELAQAQQQLADVPTSNIIVLAEAGVRPDDSWLVRDWAYKFFDMQLDLPKQAQA